MVAYQLIKELEKDNKLPLLIQKGVISLAIINYVEIYEYYNKQKEELKNRGVKKYKMQALENTCIQFNCQNNKVYYAINKMEG